MARRTKEAAEATRLEILDAAELRFLRDGVSRATLEQIAAHAGYTRGAVYWHFENKLEVLEAVLDRVVLPIFAKLETIDRIVDRPLLAVREFFRDAFEEFERDPHSRNVLEIMRLRCECIEETRPIFLRHRRLNATANAHITRALQRARQLGQLRTDADPVAGARAIQYLVDGALHEWIFSPGAMTLRGDAMNALDVLLGGLAAGSTVASDATAGGSARPARSRTTRGRDR